MNFYYFKRILPVSLLIIFPLFDEIKSTVFRGENAGLGASESFKQAGRQIKYLLAREKPVKESLSNLENYYEDIKEKGMRKLHPRWKLRRPCKVLPDPAPELVNPELVEKKWKYRPLSEDEQFFGKFAAPMRQSNPFIKYPDDGNMMMIPMMPIPVPMIQRETVYNPNPFYGYTGNYDARSEYFRRGQIKGEQKNQPTRAQMQMQQQMQDATPVQTPQAVIITPTPTPVDPNSNAQYIAALRSALESQSASFAAASMSNAMEQMRAGWLSQSIAMASQVNALSQSLAYLQPTGTR